MPLLDSNEVAGLVTPQMLLAQLDVIDARLDTYVHNRPLQPRGSAGIATQEYPTEQIWWPPESEHWPGVPGQSGWEGTSRFRPQLEAFKTPCAFTLEQMHNFFKKACDVHYIQRSKY